MEKTDDGIIKILPKSYESAMNPDLAILLERIKMIEERRQFPATNECVTNVKTVTLSQKWTIKNFEEVVKLSKPGDVLRGQVFLSEDVPDVAWQLSLYPNGKREENANHVTLFLKMSPRFGLPEARVKAEYRFYFLNDRDERVFTNVNIAEFHAKPPKGGHSWGIRNIPMEKVTKAIRQDKSFVILCEVQVMPDVLKIAKSILSIDEKKKMVTRAPNSDTDALLDNFEQVTLNSAPKYDDEFDAELVEDN